MEVTEEDLKQSIEKRFRESVMQFRGLLRWGEDRAFRQAISSMNRLFADVRESIDRNKHVEAAEKLKLLRKNMQLITSGFPEVKQASLVETSQLIDLLSNVLIADLELDGEEDGVSVSCDKLLGDLEKARFAISNEDFQLSKTIARSVVQTYIFGRQRILKAMPGNYLEDALLEKSITKVNTLVRRGGQCKKLNHRELESMLDRGIVSGIDSIRILVLGDPDKLIRLFSSLSHQILDKEVLSVESDALLIRIAVSRNFNIYIVGMTTSFDVASYRSLMARFSVVLHYLGKEAQNIDDLRKLILMCYEQKSADNIFAVGEDKVEILGLRLEDIIPKNSSRQIISPQKEQICRWLETDLYRLPVI